MIGGAKIYFIVFGILTIAGGVLGYVKAGSMASIIAGSISGVLLLLAAWLMPEHQAAGLIVALIVSLLLAGQFIPKFFRTLKVMPAGLMSVLSAIGIIVAIAAWLRKYSRAEVGAWHAAPDRSPHFFRALCRNHAALDLIGTLALDDDARGGN